MDWEQTIRLIGILDGTLYDVAHSLKRIADSLEKIANPVFVLNVENKETGGIGIE